MPPQKKYIKKIIIIVCAALFFAFITFFTWLFMPQIKERVNRVKFDSEKWKSSLEAKSNDTIRIRMVDDLLSTRKIIGMRKNEITSILGYPPKTPYFNEYDLVYWLGPERGFIPMDSEWLCIRFDAQGIATKAEVLSD